MQVRHKKAQKVQIGFIPILLELDHLVSKDVCEFRGVDVPAGNYANDLSRSRFS